MKIDRVRNAKRGILFGFIYQIINLGFPFIIQAVIIRVLSIEYLGVKGLYSSILTVFNLAELGFGSAITYSMYRPIAEDNVELLCALYNLYRKIYRIVGFAILVLGIIILPFLHFFVKGDYPSGMNIYLVYAFYLSNTVISYWLYGYKTSLLNAHQRIDIISVISTISQIICSVMQIIVLVISKNFYLFMSIMLVSTVMNNLLISFTVDKIYPQITCTGNVDNQVLNDIKKKVKGLLIGKVCGVTRNSLDSIFITAFLGFAINGIYTNYYQIIVALNAVTQIILTSLLGGVGNSIATDSKEKNYKDMIVFNNIYLMMSGFIAICMACLFQPFMQVWMGKDFLFSDYIMLLFPIYFYILKMGDIRYVYSEAAGLFWEDRWRSILEAIANIILNYSLGKKFGVLGILLATIITLLFIGFSGGTWVAFKYYFRVKMKKYLLYQVAMLFISIIIGSITYTVCKMVNIHNVYLLLVVRGLICMVIPLSLYWILLHKSSAYKEAKRFLISIIKS